MEPLTRLQDVKSLLELLTAPALDSAVWMTVAVLVYAALGVFRVPGQTLVHMCVGFAAGVPLGFPICVLVRAVSLRCVFALIPPVTI